MMMHEAHLPADIVSQRRSVKYAVGLGCVLYTAERFIINRRTAPYGAQCECPLTLFSKHYVENCLEWQAETAVSKHIVLTLD